MKAKYTKPLLAVEVFSLAQSTARDCADNVPKSLLNLTDPGVCVWDLGGGERVFAAEPNCTIINPEFFCYNNPNEENYTFRS